MAALLGFAADERQILRGKQRGSHHPQQIPLRVHGSTVNMRAIRAAGTDGQVSGELAAIVHGGGGDVGDVLPTPHQGSIGVDAVRA